MTRLGILSDSHGRAQMTRVAVAALRDAGADRLIHLGDIETEAVLDELVGHHADLVFGNCDDALALGRYAEHFDITNHHPVGRLTIDDRVVAFTHGHLPSAMQEAVRDEVDYLLHGHTHALRDDTDGQTRIINPGALFRASRYTVALLEPGSGRLEILELDPMT